MEVFSQGNEPISADIIFAHGLRGDRETTWSKDGVLWPKELLALDLPHCRIMSWGYKADVMKFFGPPSQSSILTLSLNFLEDIQLKRRNEKERKRPIVFVAHSLGGLIVKDALYQSYTFGFETYKPRLAAIKIATVGIIFAGTPHRGSSQTFWANFATNFAKAVLKDHSDVLIQALTPGSETLERLQQGASAYLTTIPVFSFYEAVPYPKIGKIVDQHSASLGFPRERQRTIDANHTEMVRYSDAKEIGYERMKGAIEELVDDSMPIGEDLSSLSSFTPVAPSELRASFKSQYQFAITLVDYSTQVPNSLEFTKNTVVEEIICSHEPFWSGRIRSQRGIFPRDTVRVIEDSAAEGYGWRSTRKLHEASLFDPDLNACLLRSEEPLYVNFTGQIHYDALYTAVKEPNVRVVQFLNDYTDFDFEEALVRPGPNGTALSCAVLSYSKSSYPPDIVEIVLQRLSSTPSLERYVENKQVVNKQVMEIFSFADVRYWREEGLINAPSAHCQRLLFYASSRGHLELVRLLIAREKVDAEEVEADHRTWWRQAAVSSAAKAGHLAVVKLLSEVDNLELNMFDDYGRTPLSLAAENGEIEVVQFLADRDGVDVNWKDSESTQTPIHRALRGGHDEVVELLLAHHKTKLDLADFLTMAAYEGRDKIVSKLVARNDVEKDKKDSDGCTPLIKAAQNGQTAVVKILVERDDVKADERSNTGQTALCWAAEKGHLAVVKILADRLDVDVNASDNAGQSPLMWAARNGRELVVRYLLSRDDVERDSSRGFTASPLAKAAKNGHLVSALRLGFDKVRKQF